MKKLVFILILIFVGKTLTAQQLPIYSQYLYNKFLINPAHAGSDGFTSINITAREQWIGYSGAPRTYSLSFQSRVLKRGYKLGKTILNKTTYRPKTDGKVGFGGYIFSDRNGLMQKTGFQGTYSYHMWLQDYTQLSLGMSLTGFFLTANVTERSFEDPSEPWLQYMGKGIFVPNVDFGAYLLNPYYDIGISAQQLLGSTAKIGSEGYKYYQLYRHYFLFGSYTFNPVIRNQIQPSFLFKISELLRPQLDVGVTYIYDDYFWTGLTYRTSGAIIANLRFKYVPSNVKLVTMFFGYAFDFTSNKIQAATYGTHEITIAIKFGDENKRFRWLDRY